MNRTLFVLATLIFAGIATSPANAATSLWAAGCTSPGRPDALTISYDTDNGKITLYQAWTNQFHRVEAFTADKLNAFGQPTIFRSHRTSGVAELPAFFETKATMYLIEGGERIQYTCAYYSFDRN